MEHMQEAFFQQLYETWFPKLCRYVASAVHDPHAAEEIVQDTFLAALGNLALLIQAEHPERWLLKTAKYKTLHYFRDRTAQRRRFLSLEESCDPAGPHNAVSMALEDAEALAETHALLRQVLKPEELRLLQWIAFEGKSYLDTAAELGCSLWACQKRMQRVRQKLRAALARQNQQAAPPPAPEERREPQDGSKPPKKARD